MEPLILESSDSSQKKRRRLARDPAPRFRPSCIRQADVVRGCIELQVPPNHLARAVWSVIERLDTSALEQQYSALGRRGYHPKRLLAVWVYASLIGLHHSTRVEQACQTDVAFIWLCGGHSPSGPTLRRMRMKQGAYFALAIDQTVRMAGALGLIEPKALAVDSVRIRAHASFRAVRTLARSTKRLQELARIETDRMREAALEEHLAKIRKHQSTIEECKRRGITSIVDTNEMAALMKFPSGASAPAHRASLVASGVSSRFVICVLVDADSTDHGKLGQMVTKAREVLEGFGLRRSGRMVIAADAGYSSEKDLEFSYENRKWVDVLVPQIAYGQKYPTLFKRDQFQIRRDGTAHCPAGRQMLGPYNNDKTRKRMKWVGVGCHNCDLRPKCTPGKTRSVEINFDRERAAHAMSVRMEKPNAVKRYNQRIATVEPVFSYLESTMGYRRCSSRNAATVSSEILLKLLAYNIDRLIRANDTDKNLFCVFLEWPPITF